MYFLKNLMTKSLSICVTLVLSTFLISNVAYAQSGQFMEGLLLLQQGQPDAAFKSWEPAANAGDPDAQYGLALLYENGGETFEADINQSILWYKKAADQGLKEAQTNLGLIYAEGRGVPQDAGSAATLWQSAAQYGHDMAQFNLGLAYYAGNGVPQNLQEAVGLIYAAAEQGLPEAQFAYGQFHRLGLGVEKSDAEAAFWFDLAARSGNADAPALIETIVGKGVSIPAAPNTAMRPILPLALEDSEAAKTYGQLAVLQPEADSMVAPIQEPDDTMAMVDPNTSPTTQPLQQAAQNLPPVDPQDSASVFDQPIDDGLDQVLDQALSPLAQPNQIQPNQVQPSQGQQAQALPQQTSQTPANLPPASPLVPIEAGQSQGLLYAAWLGTEKSIKELEQLWRATVPLQPDIFGQVQAGIETTRVGKQKAYRLMVGPFPSKSIAWQICNAVKLGNPTFFCKARVIN